MAAIDPAAARRFRKGEEGQLLSLMRGLARFEGYIDDFAVTTRDIVDAGLSYPPQFYGYVVPDRKSGTLLGMAITYIIPWTFSGKPHLVLKELYVDDPARGFGVGQRLMKAVLAQAHEIGAFRVQWTVLARNERAKAFYSRLGAQHDAQWEDWEIRLSDSVPAEPLPGMVEGALK
ncbi:MAG: GNAT family N-acetyltransferase [Pseudomonadota bacterium]